MKNPQLITDVKMERYVRAVAIEAKNPDLLFSRKSPMSQEPIHVMGRMSDHVSLYSYSSCLGINFDIIDGNVSFVSKGLNRL